jgi:predicted RNA-binding protein with PUA-like domain
VIVGECEVAREGYVDHTAFDPKHRHYDPESKQDDPQWYMVDLHAVAQFTKPVTLPQIKLKLALKEMALLRIGRLSVTPVTEKEYKVIRSMAG